MTVRVKVIVPEFGGSGNTHVGKLGVMLEHDPMVGDALVVFDSGETATINACCLQYQE